jgi:hypothetical protein
MIFSPQNRLIAKKPGANNKKRYLRPFIITLRQADLYVGVSDVIFE